jgi:hypothetical protein
MPFLWICDVCEKPASCLCTDWVTKMPGSFSVSVRAHKRLNNAFMLHASTSPFYPLFAALDINARMHQGDLSRGRLPGLPIDRFRHKRQDHLTPLKDRFSRLDGQRRFCPHKRLNNAFMLHASTSPFYPLFAALDINVCEKPASCLCTDWVTKMPGSFSVSVRVSGEHPSICSIPPGSAMSSLFR